MLRKAGGGKRPGSRSGLLSDGSGRPGGGRWPPGRDAVRGRLAGPVPDKPQQTWHDRAATWAQVDREPAPPEHRRRAPGPAAPPGCPSSAVEATEVGWSWTRRGRT